MTVFTFLCRNLICSASEQHSNTRINAFVQYLFISYSDKMSKTSTRDLLYFYYPFKKPARSLVN